MSMKIKMHILLSEEGSRTSKKTQKICLLHLEIKITSAKTIYKMHIETTYCQDVNS